MPYCRKRLTLLKTLMNGISRLIIALRQSVSAPMNLLVSTRLLASTRCAALSYNGGECFLESAARMFLSEWWFV